MNWKNNKIWEYMFKVNEIKKDGTEIQNIICNIPINVYEVYLKVSSQYEGNNYTKDYTIFDGIYNIGIHPEYEDNFKKEFIDAKFIKTYFIHKDFLNNNKNKYKLQYCFSFMEF